MDIFSDGAPVPEEYQPVRATGRYDHSKAQYIGPRARSAMGTTERGALVVTPLYDPRTGRGVLVLRGWVPDAWKAGPASRGSDGEPSGHVTVAGVVRRGEDPGTFVPDNKPEAATFYYINPAELAAAVGLPQGTPLVEIIARDEEGTRMVTPGGPPSAMEVLGGRGGRVGRPQEVYPLPKSEGDLMAFSVMPRDHLNYAATWFTLSGATALLAAKALRRGRR